VNCIATARVEPTIASLIAAADRGDALAAQALFTALYSQLHGVARRELARRGHGATLGATTLLHEAYLDIAGREAASFPDEARFIGYAARVMRGLIIDHVRERRAQKRGGEFHLTAIDIDELAGQVADDRELAGIGEALDELAAFDAHLASIVDLKFFCGFSFAEIGAMRGVSERTVQRDWDKARIYLHRQIRPHSLA
jgi:RNA polymerase sigma factor (TIGR02999 family)